MAQKLLIQKIERQFTNKAGETLINKNGKPYSFIKVHSGGKIYSAFGGTWNDAWKEGEVIEVDVQQNGNYLNIIAPKQAEKAAAIDAIHQKLDKIIELLEGR